MSTHKNKTVGAQAELSKPGCSSHLFGDKPSRAIVGAIKILVSGAPSLAFLMMHAEPP